MTLGLVMTLIRTLTFSLTITLPLALTLTLMFMRTLILPLNVTITLMLAFRATGSTSLYGLPGHASLDQSGDGSTLSTASVRGTARVLVRVGARVRVRVRVRF